MTRHVDATVAEIRNRLVALIARMAGIVESDVDVTQPVAAAGLDSVHAIDLVAEVEEWLGVELPDTLLWSHPTVERLAAHLGADGLPSESVDPLPVRTGEAVAIVGVGCRFPGARDKDEFWRLLVDRVDAIGPVPAQRWDADAFYDPVPGTPGKMTTRHGGFVDQVDMFDAGFFGLTAAEAAGMDPQQRLFLEVAWEALEDAGVPFARLEGSATGVFVGVYAGDYATRLVADPLSVGPHYGMGNALSCVPNRLSYHLGLCGPSLAIATMCSSSLVALHLACESLRKGECALAVVGGVNLVLEPHSNLWFSQIDALSPEGRCKPFATTADGMVRSDGVGAVVLKPLAQAVDDGDEVYAVVRGSAVSHNGRSNGIAAPSAPAQVAVIRTALAGAGISPGDVDYIEVHGTGTPLGDRIEIEALGTVLRGHRTPEQPCLVGTVKANIGHSESAAGIAGVIKTALALRNGLIPAHPHDDPPAPAVGEAGLRIPTEALPWPETGRPWVAGVSAFAIGGTDAHVVLESAPPSGRTGGHERDCHALRVSAATPTALRELARGYRDRLADLSDDDLAGACRTANVGRARLSEVAVVVGDGVEEIRDGLHAIAEGVNVHSGRNPRIAFAFGPLPPLGELVEPVYLEVRARCEEAVGRPLVPADDPGARRVAVFAAQAATADLLRSWGLEPSFGHGHGVGEYAAAYARGSLDLADCARAAFSGDRVAPAPDPVGEFHLVVEIGPDGGPPGLPTGAEVHSLGPDSGRRELLGVLACAESLGSAIRWEELYPARAGRVDLPTYPFERGRHWVERS